jgi:hypothetical protein
MSNKNRQLDFLNYNMKTFAFITSITCATVSLYFVIKGETLEAILFMTYAIYNKLDTKD